MATQKFKFTLARLKALPVTGKTFTVKDTETPHLQCRVSAAGKRMFEIYRRPAGKTNPVRVKIRNTATIKQIRAEAEAINAEMSAGINPNERAAIDAALEITLQAAFDQYIKSKQLAPGTVKGYQTALDRMGGWKEKPLRNITKVMVLDLYNELAEKSHTTAMRIPQVLRAVWNFQNDLTDDDAFGRPPTIILNKQKRQWSRTTTRNRKITADQLPAWLEAVRALPRQQGDGKRMAAYLEFLLLTGLRRREAGYLCWADVDMKRGYFIVRATKNHSDHCLPITRRTRQLLHAMRDNGALVFGVEEPKKAINRVTAACDVQFSCHDLRRSFATLADYSGAGSYAIKGVLNHAAGNDVTGAHYVGYKPLDDSGNVDLPEVQAMGKSLQKIEDYILQQAKAYRDNVLEVVK